MNFVNELKQAMQEAGYSSLASLSRATGIPNATLKNWSCGKSDPPDWTKMLLLYWVKNNKNEDDMNKEIERMTDGMKTICSAEWQTTGKKQPDDVYWFCLGRAAKLFGDVQKKQPWPEKAKNRFLDTFLNADSEEKVKQALIANIRKFGDVEESPERDALLAYLMAMPPDDFKNSERENLITMGYLARSAGIDDIERIK